MRNLTATLCLTLAVLLGSAGVSVSQDFQVGLDAFDRGDYATALREWTPLAEQGHAGAQRNLGFMYERRTKPALGEAGDSEKTASQRQTS
jgi:TPR repeat protein